MARMIPSGGPNITASPKAEPDIYWRLAKLSDEFVVIHSLPWLCSAVKTLDPKYAPTGELDFIVLHPELGILAMEVKGGKFKYDRNKFVYLRTNKVFDPIGQLRRGAFTLREWLKRANIQIPIGYAWIFPEIDAKKSNVPLAFEDPSYDQRVALYYTDLPDLEKHIVELMKYWKKTLKVSSLSLKQINEIVDLLCPSEEYGVDWGARIEFDNKTWLILNDQQKRALDRVFTYNRTKVYGGPGTGKTVLAISLARNITTDNKKTLFLVFNKRLAEKIKSELGDTSNIHVMTFHALCHLAARNQNITLRNDESWFDSAIDYLRSAILQKKLPNYDALIIDEGQIFHREWYIVLRHWIDRIHVFCDETQAFSFEKGKLSNEEIGQVIDEEQEFLLTINMRSPKAVFDRIEASLPTSYQQYSPRQLEQDTLEEKITADYENDLMAMLESLHNQDIPHDNVAVITSAREIKNMKAKGIFEKVMLLADLDTSEKVRGVEFPIVIVYNLDVWDTTLAINAYARATTRVIAIYHQAALSGIQQEKDLFEIQLRKNPMVSEVLKAPWEFVLKHLNWNLLPIQNKPDIYWNQNFGAWLIKSSRYLSIQEELWGAHLLLNTKYPVILVRADNDYLNVARISLPSKLLSDSAKVDYFKLASVCNKCGKYCFRDLEGNVLCCHCTYKLSARIPEETQQIFNSKPQSLPLLSLQKIELLKGQKAELIIEHVSGYFGSDKKVGYQSLLAFTGAEISNLSLDSKISVQDLMNNLMSILGEEKRLEVSKVLPTATNYWIGKKWLKKDEKGIYIRTEKSPARESISNMPSDE